MKIIITFTFAMFTLGSTFASDPAVLLNALEDSGWGKEAERDVSPEATNANTDQIKVTISQRAQVSCTRKQQTSIPQSFFNLLLSNKKIRKEKSNTSTGELILNGGVSMIGNCNSMIKDEFSHAEGGKDYTYRAGIRRPATGCKPKTIVVNGKKVEREYCKFEVETATNRTTDDEKMEITVEPNFYGFIQCMELTGVLEGGKINLKNVVNSKFELPAEGVHSTGDILFYCHGPECKKPEYKLSKHSAMKGNNCQHFEKIGKSGIKIYSQADQRKHRRDALFNTICQSGDYRLIEERLPEFSQIKWMRDILVKVRNRIIKDKIEELHTQLAKKKDFSKLDVAKYNRIISDFYSRVVLPQRQKVQQLALRAENMSDGTARNSVLKKLNHEIEKLRALAKKPYITNTDYEKMVTFLTKAPLDEEKWRNAALAVFRIQNTVFHTSRFNPKYAKKMSEEVLDLGLITAIKDDLFVQKDRIKRMGILAEDKEGNVSFAQDYKDAADQVLIDNKIEMISLKEDINYGRYVKLPECNNAAIGNWGMNSQVCSKKIYDKLGAMDARLTEISSDRYRNQQLIPDMMDQNNMANQWAQEEAYRNALYKIPPPQARASNLQVNPAAFRTQAEYSEWLQYKQASSGGNDAYSRMLQMEAMKNSQRYQFGPQTQRPPWMQQDQRYMMNGNNRGPAGFSFNPGISAQSQWSFN